MKKIKGLVGMLTVTIFSFCNVCFADLIGPNMKPMKPAPRGSYYSVTTYIAIGIVVLLAVVCAIILIKKAIKNNKVKGNNNDK